MIDHIKLYVADFETSRAFYERALEPLSFRVIFAREDPPQAGMGDGFPGFWIEQGERPTVAHVAFRAGKRETVDAFYAAALAAGGLDNGPAGLRAHYHPSYYGAFVLDPDGNNVEVVCHLPAAAA